MGGGGGKRGPVKCVFTLLLYAFENGCAPLPPFGRMHVISLFCLVVVVLSGYFLVSSFMLFCREKEDLFKVKTFLFTFLFITLLMSYI